MLVPQRADYPSDRRQRPSLPAQPTQSYLTIPTDPASPLRALAHKHAHHLHSIPPREKNTRTLIIDHMLWVHARTRFAQARAELGMTDRTGGPSSLNYIHRRRPENYDEDEDFDSDNEDASNLKSRIRIPHNPPGGDGEARRIRAQDLALARALRVRAEGVEKVVTAMLGQPPPVHAVEDDGLLTPPTSPSRASANSSFPAPLDHTLPNGVRLRLALGTIINDLFARQSPIPCYRHQFQSSSSSSEQSPADQSHFKRTPDGLPSGLSLLSTVSEAHSLTAPYLIGSQPATSNLGSSSYAPYHGLGHAQHQLQIATPGTRTRNLYKAGAESSIANAPLGSRCPRHFHVRCEICSPAQTLFDARNRGRSVSSSDFGTNNYWKGMPGGVAPGGGGISGWQDGAGIGSGLLRPGPQGSALRRKACDGDHDEAASNLPVSCGSGNTKLLNLIPRLLRLSALVVVELAMEAKDEVDAKVSRSKENVWSPAQFPQSGRFTPPVSPTLPRRASLTSLARQQEKTWDATFMPTRDWYMLLAGLLTRAVLEGYLTAGWKGIEAVEALMTVGLGIPSGSNMKDALGGFEDFDPDDLPTLVEAMKLLFPSTKPPRQGQPQEEYEAEMRDRLRMFYEIPTSTPDLSVHMEDLAWRFPAEPVERAALRFCEAISRWRGKPELEQNKKRVPTTTYAEASASPVDSFLRPGAHGLAGREPSVHTYFSQPTRESAWSQNKRLRPFEETQAGPSKRIHLL